MPRQHAVFRKFPLDGTVTVDGEDLPTPYHVYDGSAIFIGGTADAGIVSDLLDGTHAAPLLDDTGRALMAVWVCDFTDASLGPHSELQISLFATPRPIAPVRRHPFATLRALTTCPDMRMVCHGLWNNTRRVVRYNAEHLSLNAQLAVSDIGPLGRQRRFHFSDEAGHPIVEGEIDAGTASQSATAAWQVCRHIGLRGIMNATFAPFMHARVQNTPHQQNDVPLVADTYTNSRMQSVSRFSPHSRLTISHPLYATLGFVPDIVEQFSRMRFVYLRPRPESS